MAKTSKSPRAVLLAALATARQALPLYSHRYSPKKFTQHQLFACLVLKSFLKTDYRGLVAHLADCSSLVETLELASVPHYTTVQKAARRLLAAAPARRLLDATVREHLGRKRRVPRAAIDSTGLESSAASGYFVRRRQRVGMPWKTVLYHHFPKLGVVCDVQTHFILAARQDRGPKPDVADFRPLLAAALARAGIGRIAADAGYDSEPNHVFARRQRHVRTIIPAKHGRPTTKPPTGHYRRLMKTRFDEDAYRDRVQVETVISMVKRRLEAFVRGRTAWSQRRELRLKVLTHNVMILLRIEVFYRAGRQAFPVCRGLGGAKGRAVGLESLNQAAAREKSQKFCAGKMYAPWPRESRMRDGFVFPPPRGGESAMAGRCLRAARPSLAVRRRLRHWSFSVKPDNNARDPRPAMKPLTNFLGAIACGAVLLAGCGRGNKLGTIPIRGAVTYNGKPLTKGIVNYLPAIGGGGRAASGPVAPDGTFVLTTQTQHDGAVKGQYQIVIYSYDENPEEPRTREEREALGRRGAGKLKSLIPEKYTKAETSGLTDTVDENHSGFKQIDLTD